MGDFWTLRDGMKFDQKLMAAITLSKNISRQMGHYALFHLKNSITLCKNRITQK